MTSRAVFLRFRLTGGKPLTGAIEAASSCSGSISVYQFLVSRVLLKLYLKSQCRQ